MVRLEFLSLPMRAGNSLQTPDSFLLSMQPNSRLIEHKEPLHLKVLRRLMRHAAIMSNQHPRKRQLLFSGGVVMSGEADQICFRSVACDAYHSCPSGKSSAGGLSRNLPSVILFCNISAISRALTTLERGAVRTFLPLTSISPDLSCA